MSAGARKRRRMAVASLGALIASLAVGIGPATAEEGNSAPLRPLDEGGIGFGIIRGPSAPEEYPFSVTLGEEQFMSQVDEHEVAVEYSGHFPAFTLKSEPAHAADGATVPTTLELTGKDVVTLVVHHREASYAYPVMEGEGWTGGWRETTIILGPPDEKEIAEAIQREIEEAKRRVEEANPPAATPPAPKVTCTVPTLRDLSLAAAKAHLRAAHCSIGEVRLGAGASAGKGKVVKQFRAAGTELAAGAPVAVKLGPPAGR